MCTDEGGVSFGFLFGKKKKNGENENDGNKWIIQSSVLHTEFDEVRISIYVTCAAMGPNCNVPGVCEIR